MARNNVIYNEQSSQISAFLKNNMKTFLKILSGRMESDKEHLSENLNINDINLLNLLFNVAEISHTKEEDSFSKFAQPYEKVSNTPDKNFQVFNINRN